MRPPAFRTHLETIRQAWIHVVERGQQDNALQTDVDPIVLRSWQRCRPRLDPMGPPLLNTLQGDALRHILRTRSDLIAIARPFMEDVHQFVEGSGFAILLADTVTCVLEILGDAPMIDHLESFGLHQGTYWSEGSVGTNAIALALREAMPVHVVGPEHYRKIYHELCCSAAPIHDDRGRIVSALGMIGPLEAAHSHTLATVMTTARAIENQLQVDVYLQEANRRLTELQGAFSAISEGVLSWNRDGRITHINQQAGQILEIKPQSVLGRSLSEVFTFPNGVIETIQRGDTVRDVEASIGVHEQTVNCLISVRPILEGTRGTVGYIATLHPIERVRRLVHRLVGTEAMLTLENVLGTSQRIRQVRHRARLAARGNAPVLLRGETGTGKNPLARAIHNESPRADGPFLSLNCLAIPHELIVSEFLGYEGGAFSGARAEGRLSKFELADGGTLFLEDIESLSLEMQAALLQVINTGHVMRLGGTRAIPVDVRIIVATAADLEARVAEGSFRSDLYYRFGVFAIELPPLRERVEDIPVLVDRLLARIGTHTGRRPILTDEALKTLIQYPWPGNVRELENVLERIIVHTDETAIRAEHLPRKVRTGRILSRDHVRPQPVLSMVEAERQAIVRAGYACSGKVTEMAETLEISRTTLWRKMKTFNIDPQRFKEPSSEHLAT